MKKTTHHLTILLLLPLIFISSLALSQEKVYFGFGLGLDYGGIGIKTEIQPVKGIGLFGGVGYNLVDIGYNAGVAFYPLPDKRFQPVILGMYGYNAALKVDNYYYTSFSKIFYGFTMGAGCEIFDKKMKNKLSLHLLVPFRKKEFHDTYDRMEDEGVKFNTPNIPVAFTVGYNFVLKKSRKKE